MFGKKKYLFQNNNPIRISYNKTLGTPLHQDSKSIIVDSTLANNFKNGSFIPTKIDDNNVLVEIGQDHKIFNINYSIYEENTNDGLRICEKDMNNIKEDKTYFYRIKANKENEANQEKEEKTKVTFEKEKEVKKTVETEETKDANPKG